MLRPLTRILLAVLLLLFCPMLSHAQDISVHPDAVRLYSDTGHSASCAPSYTVYFRLDRVDLDTLYCGNHAVLLALDSLLSDSTRLAFVDSIHICGYSSPEGGAAYNFKLSEQRTATMQRYLSGKYPRLFARLPVSFSARGENWQGLRELVAEAGDLDERDEVLMILDEVHNADKRERLIRRLNVGNAYRYLKQRILPRLRNAMVCTVYLNHRPAGTAGFPSLSTGSLEIRADNPPVSVATSIAAAFAYPLLSARYSALKTNLAAWGLTAVNLAYETQVGRHFSLDLPLMWSSWDITPSHALRIAAFQPELRYWLSQPGYGHFFGLHAHVARYNLKWNDARYQDTGCPLLGAGFSYGYLLPFNDTWGMEFTLGAGYAHTRYHLYRNVSNGALTDTRTLNYWGITRLGLSFIYKLPQP